MASSLGSKHQQEQTKSWNDLLSEKWIFRQKTFVLLNTYKWKEISESSVESVVHDWFTDSLEVRKISDGFLVENLSPEERKSLESALKKKFHESWVCFEKHVPPLQENGFFIKGEGLHEQDIKKHLKNIQSKPKGYKHPIVESLEGVVRVMYDHKTDISHIRDEVDKRKLNGGRLKTRDLCFSDCIKVTNLKISVSTHEVKEKIKQICRCQITHVDTVGDQEVYVYLSNYKNAEATVKILNSDKKLDAKFSLFYPLPLDLQPPQNKFDQRNVNQEVGNHSAKSGSSQSTSSTAAANGNDQCNEDDDINDQMDISDDGDISDTSLGQSSSSQSQSKLHRSVSKGTGSLSSNFFDIHVSTSFEVLEFVVLSKNVLKQFKQELQNLEIEVDILQQPAHTVQGTSVFYTIRCKLPDNWDTKYPDKKRIEQKCRETIDGFLSEFVSKTVKFHGEEIYAVRSEMGWDKEDSAIIGLQTNTYGMVSTYIKWNDMKPGNVTLTCSCTCIDEVFATLKNATARLSKPSTSYSASRYQQPKVTFPSSSSIAARPTPIKMEPHLVRWFVKCAPSDSNCSRTFTKVVPRPTKGGLELDGEDEDAITRAMQLVTEMTPQLHTNSKSLGDSDLRILSSERGRNFSENVETTTSCAIHLNDGVHSNTQWPRMQVLAEVLLPNSNVKVRVVQNDITEHDCDAIVNASNCDLKLRSSGVSGSIKKKGGKEIQLEMDRMTQGTRFLPGMAITTSSGTGGLRCKYVIHTIGPYWHSTPQDQAINELRRAIFESLKNADAHYLTSVAFPCISAGVFGGKPDVCVNIIMVTILEYLSTNKGSNVKRIDLVEMSNQTVIRHFLNAVKQYDALSKPNFSKQQNYSYASAVTSQPATSPQQFGHGFGRVRVVVKQGDITSEVCHAIVNPSDSSFSFGGLVARKILQKGGNAIRDECHSWSKTLQWSFRVTSGGKLPCANIFHIAMPTKLHHLQKILVDVFVHADSSKLTTLALPAVGTGALRGSTRDSAHIIRKAIEVFEAKKPVNLTEIRVVIWDKQAMKDFRTILTPNEGPSMATERYNSGHQQSALDLAGFEGFGSGANPPGLLYCASSPGNLAKAMAEIDAFLRDEKNPTTTPFRFTNVQPPAEETRHSYQQRLMQPRNGEARGKGKFVEKIMITDPYVIDQGTMSIIEDSFAVHTKVTIDKYETYIKIKGESEKKVAEAKEDLQKIIHRREQEALQAGSGGVDLSSLGFSSQGSVVGSSLLLGKQNSIKRGSSNTYGFPPDEGSVDENGRPGNREGADNAKNLGQQRSSAATSRGSFKSGQSRSSVKGRQDGKQSETADERTPGAIGSQRRYSDDDGGYPNDGDTGRVAGGLRTSNGRAPSESEVDPPQFTKAMEKAGALDVAEQVSLKTMSTARERRRDGKKQVTECGEDSKRMPCPNDIPLPISDEEDDSSTSQTPPGKPHSGSVRGNGAALRRDSTSSECSNYEEVLRRASNRHSSSSSIGDRGRTSSRSQDENQAPHVAEKQIGEHQQDSSSFLRSNATHGIDGSKDPTSPSADEEDEDGSEEFKDASDKFPSKEKPASNLYPVQPRNGDTNKKDGAVRGNAENFQTSSNAPTPKPRKAGRHFVASSSRDERSESRKPIIKALSKHLTVYNVAANGPELTLNDWCDKKTWSSMQTNEWALQVVIPHSDRYTRAVEEYFKPDLQKFVVERLFRVKNPKLHQEFVHAKKQLQISESNKSIGFIPATSAEFTMNVCEKGSKWTGETGWFVKHLEREGNKAMASARPDESGVCRIIMVELLPDNASTIVQHVNFHLACPVYVMKFSRAEATL